MNTRSARRVLVLAAAVASASGLAACGPAKATTASPATSAPTVVESSPPAPSGAPSAAPSDGSSTGPSSGSSSNGTCKASAMAEDTYGGDGAAGTISTGIVLTNKTSASCVVSGYPTLAFVDTAGKAYKVEVDHITGTTATKVAVAAGGKAYFTVRLSDVPVNDQKAPCSPAAAGMLISLSSDGSNSVEDKGAWRACGIAHVGPLTAKPDPNLHN